MTFTTGLTIQKINGILPSMWVEIASAIGLQHIEFDQTVFEDIENVIRVLKAPQTVIHAPYVEDYGIDLSSNDRNADQFVKDVIDAQRDLNTIGVVIHPPSDAGGSWEIFYNRLEKIPFPLLENMPYQSWEEFQEFMENVKANVSKKIGMCFDIPHSWITNGEKFLDLPKTCLDFLRARTGYIHVSGGTREEDTHYPLLTEGDIPLNPVKNFLDDISFSGTVTMELAPRSIDDLNKIFKSYMLMLKIARKNRHNLQVKIKRPFIMRKVRKLTKKSGSGSLSKR